MKHFIEITDFTLDELNYIFQRTNILKKAWNDKAMPKSLTDSRIALWFYGKGFRNRLAFEIGARAMGADISYIPGELGINEPLEDIGHYLKNWFSMAIIRCKKHHDLEYLKSQDCLPLINARTNFNHPCEIISDLYFVLRKRKSLDNLNVVFVGEVTNLCMSWMKAALRFPIHVTQVAPKGYLLSKYSLDEINQTGPGKIELSTNLNEVINSSTDILYTDCWPKEDDFTMIKKLFLPYQIKKHHLETMNSQGFFLPCPPVTRGQEVSEESLASPLCRNYEAKDDLLHTQNAIMEFLLKENKF